MKISNAIFQKIIIIDSNATAASKINGAIEYLYVCVLNLHKK